ncbi:MAG: protein kinase domain-containing protein [Gemmatimonadales bacterium]
MPDLRDQLQSALGPLYRLTRELGGGGMSRVFLAEEVGLGRSVVIKVLPPEMGAAVSVERFRREIQLAAKLQHPHIVPLLTAGAGGDLLYYVMPHVEGESLRARLVRDRELPVGEAVRILRDVTDALAYAHGHGIVHRDIKPDNVLLSGKHALVTDFGVAKAVSQSTGATALTSLGVALGTPAYMAPEQAAADPNTDHRADIYAVGALAYEMLSGRPPFTGTSPQLVLAAQVTATPDPLTRWRAAVPPALEAIVMRCLAKLPADRWQSAEEVHAQLEAMTTPTGGTTPTAAVPYPAAAYLRGHPLRVTGLFLLGAFAVLGVVSLLARVVGLPGWVLPWSAGLLVLGLPIMIVTGLVERHRALARTGSTPPAAGIHRWLTWRRALAGGAAAFALLCLVAAAHIAMRALGIGPVGTLVASGVLAARDRLVLADFENRTSDSTLGPSVTEALRVDLAQSPVVTLLDAAATSAALRRMNRDPGTPIDATLARELAEREGAKGIVRGEIGPVGQGYVLTAEVVSAADGTVLVAVRETARDDGAIIEAIDRLSGRLRERIGESLRTIQSRQRLEQVTTASLEALQKYSQALRTNDQGDVDRAITLLEQAVALDTSFAMAYRKLAVALSNTQAETSRVQAAATHAFRHRDRLPPLERELTTAYYYSNVEFDRAKTMDAYRSALEADPEDLTALNNLTIALNDVRRFAEAESLALRGLAIGSIAPLYVNAADAQVAQGKLAEARKTFELFAQRAPGHPFLKLTTITFATVERRYDDAERSARLLLEPTQALFWRTAGAAMLSEIEQIRGRLGAAEAHQRQAMAWSEERRLPANYVRGAVALACQETRLRGRPGAALTILDAALQRYPLSRMDAADRPYTDLAIAYAEAGRPERARALMREYEAAVPETMRRGDPDRYGAAAAIAMAEGSPRDAIAPLRAEYDEAGCGLCGLHELGRAYELAGEADSAIATYERALTTPRMLNLHDEATTLAPTYRRLGELYEARGDRARARDYYGRFVNLWNGADQELQPAVREVRQRLAQLAEGG